MNKILVLLAVVLIAGCMAMASNINTVSLGMTKQEVIARLGEPAGMSAINDIEYMNYTLRESMALGSYPDKYFVRLRNGKVDAYGRHGDFGTTASPKSVVDLNVKQEGENKK
jgi:hypothetical protein